MKRIPQIVLVDDHLPYRQGLKSFITELNIAIVMGEASNGLELLELLTQFHPDVILMDIEMPLMNGIEATHKALKLAPDLKIIAFSMYGDDAYLAKMIGLGAKGFLTKSCSITELEKAINEVMMGKTYFNPDFQMTNNTNGSNTTKPIDYKGSIAEEHIELKTLE